MLPALCLALLGRWLIETGTGSRRSVAVLATSRDRAGADSQVDAVSIDASDPTRSRRVALPERASQFRDAEPRSTSLISSRSLAADKTQHGASTSCSCYDVKCRNPISTNRIDSSCQTDHCSVFKWFFLAGNCSGDFASVHYLAANEYLSTIARICSTPTTALVDGNPQITDPNVVFAGLPVCVPSACCTAFKCIDVSAVSTSDNGEFSACSTLHLHCCTMLPIRLMHLTYVAGDIQQYRLR